MFEQIVNMVPEQWRGTVEMLLVPISWIPGMQDVLLMFFSYSDSGWAAAAKFAFLLLPVLLWATAVWCTLLAVYTVPFRSHRVSFFSTLALTWWDGARAVWLYWVGTIRAATVIIGWGFTLVRLAVKLLAESVRQIIMLPFTVTGRMTQSYFKPGVPWIAFVMLLFWCALETTIFTYTLFPTVSEVIADLVGADTPALMGPVLWLFLFMLIAGSFACVQALIDAVKARDVKFLAQMIVVELFVMFFEVMFLYRELVDAVTPWIAQQTSEEFRMGIGMTLALATFGWLGIRGMTWFLFAQFGTPPLLAFISRRPLVDPQQATPLPVPETTAWWHEPIEDFKREIAWLHEKSEEMLEFLALPALHVLGAMVNFPLTLVTSRPIFTLPFKSLKEVMSARQALGNGAVQLQPKKVMP